MDELRYIKPIKLFADAEEKRLRDIMSMVWKYDSPQVVHAHYDIRKSELMPTFRVAGDIKEEYMKIFKDGKLSHRAESAVNIGIESIMIGFVKELARQGLIICKIKESRYNPQAISIELSAVVGVPEITQKRLDINF